MEARLATGLPAMGAALSDLPEAIGGGAYGEPFKATMTAGFPAVWLVELAEMV